MELQLAGYRFNVGRGDSPSFFLSIFKVQNQSLNRSCGVVQNLTGVFVIWSVHPSKIPCR